MTDWIPYWSRHLGDAQAPEHWSDGGDTLPKLNLDQLDATLLTFPHSTGLGFDQLHPRSIRMLPRTTRLRMLDLFHAWEEAPQILLILLTTIVFLDKKTGGARPIGLIVSLLRIWSRLRQPVASAREKTVEAECRTLL